MSKYKAMPFSPRWDTYYGTEGEALEKGVQFIYEDYVAVWELKKLVKINRSTEEVSLDEVDNIIADARADNNEASYVVSMEDRL